MRNRLVVDEETGEIIEPCPGFVMIKLERSALRDFRLGLVDLRVFGYLVEVMNRFGYVGATQRFMAAKVGVTQPQFSRSIGNLLKFGYVFRVDDGTRKRLQVNRKVASKRGSGDFYERED